MEASWLWNKRCLRGCGDGVCAEPLGRSDELWTYWSMLVRCSFGGGAGRTREDEVELSGASFSMGGGGVGDVGLEDSGSLGSSGAAIDQSASRTGK